MEKELDSAAMIAQAEALYLDAAIMMTRLGTKMRRAVRLVILDKMTPSAAARRVGRHRNHVLRAVKKARAKMDQVKAESANT